VIESIDPRLRLLVQLPIRAICVFHAVAKAGSISKAAAELCVTPSAVSQQIQLLEVQLGTCLVAKIGRHIALTEAGERYFESIRDGVEKIADATNHIRGFRSITVLNVRATPTLSNKWLLPRLGSFLDLNPDTEVRLDATNEPTDFDRDSIDIEIRHGDGQFHGLFVEALAEENFWPVCSPKLANINSLEPRDLPSYRLIHSVKAQVQWTQWFSLVGVQSPGHWRKVLFDRSHMAIDAAAGGLGIALESTLMFGRELASGALIRPVREAPNIRLTTQWIVCPRDRLRKKKVRLFLDWLQRERDEWQAMQPTVKDEIPVGEPSSLSHSTEVPQSGGSGLHH
jgi:LysR family transcriptional regulator, glycine cleavage system transcriptional activator